MKHRNSERSIFVTKRRKVLLYTLIHFYLHNSLINTTTVFFPKTFEVSGQFLAMVKVRNSIPPHQGPALPGLSDTMRPCLFSCLELANTVNEGILKWQNICMLHRQISTIGHIPSGLHDPTITTADGKVARICLCEQPLL